MVKVIIIPVITGTASTLLQIKTSIITAIVGIDFKNEKKQDYEEGIEASIKILINETSKKSKI